MSMQQMLKSHSSGDGGSGGGRPSIVPTRRRLDRRFPSLGFTVATNQPWVEVLVAIDPGLFDPARSDTRTSATFYASRTQGGLTATVGGRARYVVPASVVARLGADSPSLWFLAIGYPDGTGVGGTPSTPGQVAIDASLRPQVRTLHARSAGLGRTLNRVDQEDRLAGEDGLDLRPPGATTEPLGGGPTAAGLGWRRRGLDLDDRLQGEDGSDLAATTLPPPAPPVSAAPGTPPPAPVTPAIPQPASPPLAAPVASPAGPTATNGTDPLAGTAPANGTPAALDVGYDDGWGSLDPATVPSLSAIPALSDEYPDIDWGGVDVADKYGEVPAYQSLQQPPAPAAPTTPPSTARPPLVLPRLDLSADQQRRIIELVAGNDGTGYAAVNTDGPFRGRHGPGHKAYQRFHTGLSYGVAEFNQDSGTLGQLLRLMQEREPDTFAAVFGDAAGELVATTTAPGPSGEFVEGGRGPRVQPVSGSDLWDEPWLSKFRAAGAVPAFRAAQNQLAAELYLAPMLTVAAGFGLTSERALCMVLDRAIALGDQGAKRWTADTVGPVRTHALRQAALTALGFETIEAFQAAVPGLLNDGEFGPVTHAALTAALRALGPASPLPLPETQQSVEEMARRGQGEDGAARLLRLAGEPGLGDVPIGG